MAVYHCVVNWNDFAIDAGVPTCFVRLGYPFMGLDEEVLYMKKAPVRNQGF